MSDIAAPTISVLMSVFNGEAFLAEAVESIRNQTFSDFEFLVVDDGSVDGTAEILAAQSSQDARIRVLTQENLGLITALNRGISEARGRYIARMDADDISMPDRFAKQLAYLETRPDVGVLGGAVVEIDRHGNERGVLQPLIDHQAIRDRLVDNSPVAHPTAMIRTALLVEVGGYRAAFRRAEDYDLWLRISERADIANLPDIVLRYRVHGGNVSRINFLEKFESALLAQASARARHRDADDPADQLDGFPDDFVQRFLRAGESPDWIERTAAAVLAARAVDKVDIPTARVWIRAVRAARPRGQQRRMLVEHLVNQARRRLAVGDFGRGFRLLYWAVSLRFTRAMKALLTGSA